MQGDGGWERYDSRSYTSKLDLYDSSVPEEIRGWNWGAFLIPWLWGLSNRVWQVMYLIIPFYGLYYAFVLGSRGNEFAWKARPWRSVEEFKATQRNWAIAGFAWVLVGGGIFALLLFGNIQQNARTVGDNPVCLNGDQFDPVRVDCSSSDARYQLLHQGMNITDCRDFPKADITSTNGETGEITCLRTIPQETDS